VALGHVMTELRDRGYLSVFVLAGQVFLVPFVSSCYCTMSQPFPRSEGTGAACFGPSSFFLLNAMIRSSPAYSRKKNELRDSLVRTSRSG
jgi:hypothetical protein